MKNTTNIGRRDLIRLASISAGVGALSSVCDAAALGARGVAISSSGSGSGMEGLIAQMNKTISGEISLPGVKEVPMYEFYQCYGLTKVNLPDCTAIKQYAFGNEVRVDGSVDVIINAPNLTVATNCFKSIRLIDRGIDFSKLTSASGFNFCTAGDLYNSNFTSLDRNFGDFKFKSITLPNVTVVDSYSFQDNGANYISLGTLTSVGNNSFVGALKNGGELRVLNTMSSLRSVSGFPWNFNTNYLFVCSDGYISYENGVWTDHQTNG